MRIDLKPLSVNEAWQGKRYRSDKYNAFKKHLTLLLKPLSIPEGELTLNVKFGFSSHGSDIDNPLKPLIDVLQKKYGFNDNRIYKLTVEKEIVKKGKEYIEFELSRIQEEIKTKIKELKHIN